MKAIKDIKWVVRIQKANHPVARGLTVYSWQACPRGVDEYSGLSSACLCQGGYSESYEGAVATWDEFAQINEIGYYSIPGRDSRMSNAIRLKYVCRECGASLEYATGGPIVCEDCPRCGTGMNRVTE